MARQGAELAALHSGNGLDLGLPAGEGARSATGHDAVRPVAVGHDGDVGRREVQLDALALVEALQAARLAIALGIQSPNFPKSYCSFNSVGAFRRSRKFQTVEKFGSIVETLPELILNPFLELRFCPYGMLTVQKATYL